jgi:predicted nucleic acid-binding protein
MEKLFVDTNVVIDLLSKRELFYKEAQELFTLAEINNKIMLYVSALTFANTQYYTALVYDMDVIITRNAKDFNLSKFPVMNAKEYLIHESN